MPANPLGLMLRKRRAGHHALVWVRPGLQAPENVTLTSPAPLCGGPTDGRQDVTFTGRRLCLSSAMWRDRSGAWGQPFSEGDGLPVRRPHRARSPVLIVMGWMYQRPAGGRRCRAGSGWPRPGSGARRR